MDIRASRRRSPRVDASVATALVAIGLTFVLAGCASSASGAPTTGSPDQVAVTASAEPSGSASLAASFGPSDEVTASPSSGSSDMVASASPSDEASASLAVSASPVGEILPPPGAAHRFGCHGLASDHQVSALTSMPSVLFVLPSNIQGPTLAKGETVCKWLGAKKVGSTYDTLTTDIYVLTDGARTQFDQNWAQYRDSSLVETVDGIGDDAAYLAAEDSLFGIKGAVAFEVTLEPLPLSMYTPSAAKAAVLAIARIVASHI